MHATNNAARRDVSASKVAELFRSLVRELTITMTYSASSGGRGEHVTGDQFRQEAPQIGPGGLPLERRGDLFIVGLKPEQAVLEGASVTASLGVRTLRCTIEK